MSNSCAISKADVVKHAKPLLMDFCIQCQIMVIYTQWGWKFFYVGGVEICVTILMSGGFAFHTPLQWRKHEGGWESPPPN